MSSRLKLLLATTAIAVLGGCAAVDPGMGEAAKYNQLAQTINPDPVYPPDALQPGSDGVHAQKATERYRKDAVKAVQVMSSATGGGASGGSPGGGSGQK